MRYSAFISYSYQDKAWASWLHRALEAYRLPSSVLGRPGPFGPISAKLPPVFRDREELSAAPDLERALSAALAEAETLIVVCSPDAARSRWVNQEIREFVRLGRADHILCLIVNADHGADESLPPALMEGGRAEPLAADVRPDKDGREHAKLKLIAGILGLNYDELRRREASRRQHQLTVVAAASVAGLALTSSLAVFAVISRDEAVRQRNIAERRRVTAERTVDFVKSMFKMSDPSEARGAAISARDVLDAGARQIQTGLANEPAVKAELGSTLGEVYQSLGFYQEGDRLIRQTFSIRHGQSDVTVDQMQALGDSDEKLGDYQNAIAVDRQAIALAGRSDAVGPEVRSRLYEQLAQAQTDDGQNSEAESSAGAALRIDQARSPPDPSDVARDLEVGASAEMAEEKWAAAKSSVQQALTLRLAAEGPNSPSVADNLNALGDIAWATGDLSDAETDYRRVMAIDAKVFDPDHPDVAAALNNLARVMVDRREFSEAVPLLLRAVQINEKRRTASNDDMAFVFSNLALAERGIGHTGKSISLFQKALAIARQHHHRMLAPILSELADIKCQRGDVPGGEQLLAEARPIMLADYSHVTWRNAWIDSVMGECLLRGDNVDAGRALIFKSTPVLLNHWTPDSLYGYESVRRLQLARGARPSRS